MKVLMLTSSYPTRPGDWRGGFVRDLARALIARDVDVEVAAPRPPPVPRDADDEDDGPPDSDGHGPRVAWLPSLLPADGRAFHGAGIEANLRAAPLGALTLPPFLLAFAAEAAVRSVFADVVVAHWLLPMGAVGAFLSRLGRKPLVVVAHSGPAGVLAVPPLRNAVRPVVRSAAAVACVSDAVRDRVAAVAGPRLAGRLRVVPIGIDPRPRVAGPGMPAAGGGRAPLSLLFVGRLIDLKGVDLLLRAAAAAGGGVRVTVIGDGPEAGALRSLAAGLDAPVRWLGECPHDRALAAMSSHDVQVVPSRRGFLGREEGMPRVAVEAWAAGTPVLASDTGGTPAAIRAGGGGLTFRAGDEADLRRAIERLRDDAPLRDRLRGEAEAQAEAWSWRRLAPAWVELLEGAARGRIP